jgi:hypothetical protein
MRPILMRTADADFLRSEVHPAVREVGYTTRGAALGAESFDAMYVFVEDAAIERSAFPDLVERCLQLSEAQPGEVVHVVGAGSRKQLYASDWVDGRPPPPPYVNKQTWQRWLDEDKSNRAS